MLRRPEGAALATRFRLRLVSILLAAYVVIVIAMTLTPTAPDRPIAIQLRRIIQELQERGLPAFIGYPVFEFTANVLMFLPLGLLIALLLPRHLWWAAIICGAWTSSFIEFSQLLLLPGRVASIGDIIANSLGALLGALLAVAVRRAVHRRDLLLYIDVRAGRRVL
ncbi:VanZ family protein [Naasia lichenicola]|nr:VanZ family protein [Naasia lichenicola]